MKKENFVGGGTVDPNWLDELVKKLEGMIQDHNYGKDSHQFLQSLFYPTIDLHSNSNSHVSDGDRTKWDNAADAVELLKSEQEILGEIENAKIIADSAKTDAIIAKSDVGVMLGAATLKAQEAGGYASSAEAHMETAQSEAAKAKGCAVDAELDAGLSRSYMNKASEYAGNAFNHAGRAEAAAKKAERFSGVSSGVVVDRVEDLPEDASVGVIHAVKERVATNGFLVTGKVSELFLTGYAREDFETDDDPGRMYLYAPRFSVPDAYVSSTDCICVYDCSGRRILQMSYPHYGGYPDWEYLSTFGADSVDDEITLYVGELSKPMELEPEAIIFEDVERAMYYNGESWVEVVTTRQLGDIDKALDAILDLDAKLLGGDA